MSFCRNSRGRGAEAEQMMSARRDNGSGGSRAVERALLVWFLGVPVPVLTLVWLFGGLH